MKKTLILATVALSSLMSVALAGSHYEACPTATALQSIMDANIALNVSNTILEARMPYCHYVAVKTGEDGEQCPIILSTIMANTGSNGVKCDYHPSTGAYNILVSRYYEPSASE